MTNKNYIIKPELHIERYDPSTGIIMSSRKVPFNSFTMNFLRTIFYWYNNFKFVNSGGTWRTLTDGSVLSGFTYYQSAAGNQVKGIVVGSGTTAGNNFSLTLDTLIPHGTGAGELSYGANSYSVTDLANGQLYHERSFVNNSGASVAVNEIAWRFTTTNSTTDTANAIQVARDIIPGGETIPNGQALRVRYTFNFGTVANRNLITLLSVCLTGVLGNFKNITGAGTNWTPGTGNFSPTRFLNAVSTLNRGLKIGTGTDAEDTSMNNLVTRIETDAVGVDHQINCQVSLIETTSGSIGRLTRGILNETGATIGVNEVGVFGFVSSSEYMHGRKKLATTYDILDNEAVTVVHDWITTH